MVKKCVVKTGSIFPDLWQTVPWYRREIMVFVVIAHVEGNDIQYAVVAKGFLFFVMGEIMFLDPPGAQWVKSYGEEEAGKKIYDGFGAEGIPHAGCEGYFS